MKLLNNIERLAQKVEATFDVRRRFLACIIAGLMLADATSVVASRPSHVQELQIAYQEGDCQPTIIVDSALDWVRAHADGIAASHATGRCPDPMLEVVSHAPSASPEAPLQPAKAVAG